ncbi:MAG: hypothetical protein Q9178_005316 [Gyalolechia marmorata]
MLPFLSDGPFFGNDTNDGLYWLVNILHQERAAFHNAAGNYTGTNTGLNSTGKYQVFRNVKAFGARGDGFNDDTAAINRAISSGSRCAPGVCQSSTISPAIAYFPSGTHLGSSPVIDNYYTQIIGNPNDLPVIKAASNFSGSGGFMSDLTFNGGQNAAFFGNQQFTVRDFTISNAINAIDVAWDWVLFLKMSYSPMSAVQSKVLAIQPSSSAPVLVDQGRLKLELKAIRILQTGRLLYQEPFQLSPGLRHCLTMTSIMNVPSRSTPICRLINFLARGQLEPKVILQDLFIRAASIGRIVFLDAGVYKIRLTLHVPMESRIGGEAYPVVMSSGSFFANMDSPQPVVQVGQRREEGCVEWSDTIVSTQGAQPGAVAIQWNLLSSGNPSGMWDVHVRIGGFAGSRLQLADCPITPDVATPPAPVKKSCIGAHTSMHVATGVRGLYLETVWLWTADYGLDDANSTRTSIYAGRGLIMQADSDI